MQKLSINQWAEEDRPREKMMRLGAAALSNAELLAILIGSGSQDESAVDLMKRVLADSPAERAGLRPFDIVLAVDGEDVRTAHRLLQRIARMRPGDTVTLSVLRGPQTINLPLVVSRRPSGSLEREEFLSDENTSEP